MAASELPQPAIPGGVGVVGAGLAGLAAGARLARAGHRVIILESAPALPLAEVATEPGGTVFTLPAAWRDLFRKSGRPLEAELSRRGWKLAPAPPRRHRFADGSVLDLGSERGEQWLQLSAAFGEPAATAWRDLLDRLDQAWQVLRSLGAEAEFAGRRQLTPAAMAVLRPRQNLAGLAAELPAPQLAELVLAVAARLGQDPARLPGWHAFRLALERSFGRWQLVDADDRPQPATHLAELLAQRLGARGVEVRTAVTVEAIRPTPGGLRLETSDGQLELSAVISTVDPGTHADLTRERADYRIARRLRAAPGGGPRWSSWRTLLDLPGLQPAGRGALVASPWSPAGPDSWAQLLTGALAAYRVHQDLTGEDMRPTNKAYRPGPLPR